MRLSQLKSANRHRLEALRECCIQEEFWVFAQKTWTTYFSPSQRKVLVGCLINSSVKAALHEHIGHRVWQTLIRSLLDDVFQRALVTATAPFASPDGLQSFYNLVLNTPEGINGHATLTKQHAAALEDLLRPHIPDHGSIDDGTVMVLMHELRTTYTSYFLQLLTLQILRVASCQGLDSSTVTSCIRVIKLDKRRELLCK